MYIKMGNPNCASMRCQESIKLDKLCNTLNKPGRALFHIEQSTSKQVFFFNNYRDSKSSNRFHRIAYSIPTCSTLTSP